MATGHPHLGLGARSLTIGGVGARELAEEYGTPCYVTDLDRVCALFVSADAALKARHRRTLIAFATKSNPTPAVLKELAKRGSGATVVSAAGIRLALRCGVAPEDVVFDGPSKSPEEIRSAIKARVGMINAESTQEVLDIEKACVEAGAESCRVGLRVNLGIRATTHAGLATGAPEHKFGIQKDEAVGFCRKEGRSLRRARIVGVHSHIGSQILGPGAFVQLAGALASFSTEVEEATGARVEEVNFGGGLGFAYERNQKMMPFRAYAKATAGVYVSKSGSAGKATRLVFELGRSLVADSTVLLTRVNYVKRSSEKDWALVDAGMNDFLRPALYGAYHEVVPGSVSSHSASRVAYDIGGPVCETTDVLGSGRRLGVRLSQGDVLAVLDAGAYGISMASGYNMRPIPPVVVVSNGGHALATPRRPYRVE